MTTIHTGGARFALGDRVVTPRGEEGEVVIVYPPRVSRGKPGVVYGVSVPSQATALVCYETELRAAAHVPEGATVRCADCIHGRKSHFAPNTVRCAVLHRACSASSLRICKRHQPRQET